MLSQLCQSTLRWDKTFSKYFSGMCHQSEAKAFLRGTKNFRESVCGFGREATEERGDTILRHSVKKMVSLKQMKEADEGEVMGGKK